MNAPPISAAVLIDLHCTALAGGHVKTWERLAESATALAGQLDLTIYFLGDREETIGLSGNVRYRTLPPRRGTGSFWLTRDGPAETDLARFHPALARLLPRHQILHLTSQFGFALTAERVARRQDIPMVLSLHTDVPYLTRIYTRQIVERVVGLKPVARWVVETAGVGGLASRMAARRDQRLLAACDRVLVSNRQDLERAAGVVPRGRIGLLRRGLDRRRFSPDRREPGWLTQTYGVPPDRPVVLFAGRLDESKRVLTAAGAVRHLRDAGVACHFLGVGAGAAAAEIRAMLGADCTLPGAVPQEELARIYANADVFLFPSESETFGNVVIEAKASGLPVVLSALGRSAALLAADGEDGIAVADTTPAGYAAALRPLLESEAVRQRMGAAALRSVERTWPSWNTVLEEDVMPVWAAVAQRRHAAAPRP